MEQQKKEKIKQAVALSYDPKDNAPTVIASGKGALAERIIEKAKEANVPLHRDDKLADTLSRLEIGEMIPPELYEVVAEILVFVDAMDNPDKYVDKIVRFKGRVMKPRGMGSKFFVPGRVAMTCCADDTTFLGYVCRSDYAPHIKEGSWVEVTAKVAFENRTEYQGEGIVLYASDVKECEPLKEEMVYFN